tara:strand:+ start:209 stop:313 length:105 start_codon:yes stop_codon:yes gene_type:complete
MGVRNIFFAESEEKKAESAKAFFGVQLPNWCEKI